MNSGDELIPKLFKRKLNKRKRKKRGDHIGKWEMLGERGITGIDSLPGGGLVSAPVSGKALPRVGRRLNAIPSSKKPKDGDGDGMVTNPLTGRDDMPLPAATAISGAMNVKKYIGDAKLIEEQGRQTSLFEKWASERDWSSFHREHYDWWTFPIDKGSAPTGFAYDVSGEPLERLKNNSGYLTSLSRAAQLYALSLGWNIRDKNWIPNPEKNRGQGIPQTLNGQRIFKVARSLQIHGLNDDFDSIHKMASSLRKSGVNIGNNDYWASPNTYVMRSRFKDSNGSISGSMSGLGISPRAFKNQQNDPRKEASFLKRLRERDTRNKNKDGSAGDLTFDWRDDESRKAYLARLWGSRLASGDANFGGINIASGTRHNTSAARKGLGSKINSNLMDALAGLGLHWGPGSSEYSGFYDPFGSVLKHSTSAKNPDGAEAEQIRDIKGIFAPTINPNMYWQRFESWIRNPFSVMYDPSTKRDVGVRLYFNDDRDRMVQEFNRRIANLYDEIADMYGRSREQQAFEPLAEHVNQIPKYRADDVPEFIRGDIKRLMDSQISKLTDNSTIRGLHTEIIENLRARNLGKNSQGVTQAWLEGHLREEYPEWLGKQLKMHPNFMKASPLDSLDSSQLSYGREMMSLLHFENMQKGQSPSDIDLGEAKRTLFQEPWYTDEIIKELHEAQIRINEANNS